MHYKTHDLGPLFVHGIKLKKGSPLVHTFPSHEMEEPYRKSNTIILRLPRGHRGVAIGWWRRTTRTEEQALLEALQGRQMTDDEFSSAEKETIQKRLVDSQFSVE